MVGLCEEQGWPVLTSLVVELCWWDEKWLGKPVQEKARTAKSMEI